MHIYYPSCSCFLTCLVLTVGADPLLQHQDAQEDVQGPETAERPRRPRARGAGRGRGRELLRAAWAGPGPQPGLRAAAPDNAARRGPREEGGHRRQAGRRGEAISGRRGARHGDGRGRVHAVPHAGDDVPRVPGLPQLQVPAPDDDYKRPRRVVVSDAGAGTGASQARAPAALLQGLEFEPSIEPNQACMHSNIIFDRTIEHLAVCVCTSVVIAAARAHVHAQENPIINDN